MIVMRFRPRALLARPVVALLAVAYLGLSPLAQADFSAKGRRGKTAKPAAAAPANSPRPNAAARRAPAPAAPDKASPKTPAAEHEKREAGAPLIARYTAIALSQPGSAFPLERLAQLYRERDGRLDQLIADFEQRSQTPGPDQWNAKVVLAGIYRQAGKPELAVQTYQAANKERPANPIGHVALAHLYLDANDKAAARAEYETAYPLIKDATDAEQALRALLGLSLDLSDFAAAERYHKQLVARAKGSFFARAELGRELLTRGQYERAEREYRELVKSAAGDNRALAPALRDLGVALMRQKKREEALTVLKRALIIAGDQSGMRREIFDLTAEVYRADDRLGELVELLEQEKPRDFERLRMLAELYEETGQLEKAIATYRNALNRGQRDISTHLKLVQLLQIQGELDQAVAEYERLIQAAPNNPDFVFQLAEALLQQGNRQKALDYLKRLEERSAGDPDILAALVNFYERVEEGDRALGLLERLAQSGGEDLEHIIELGNRYYEAGEREKAQRTWKRVLALGKNRALAQQTLGEVYLEHDMVEAALEALHKAVELAPKDVRFKKAYALALERSGASLARGQRLRQYEEAQKIWDEILRENAQNEALMREARQHIVTLWSLSGELPRYTKPLERRLQLAPPDLDAGRLLAEAQIRLRRYAEAERTLRTVVKHAPADVASQLSLERVLVLSKKLEDAIKVLEGLAELEPKRAREYYQRMAQYAAELYQDDRALKIAAKVVELSPDDADGHRRLAEMYRRRQEPAKAVAEFRKALSKNDRLFPVYFDLAELLLNQNDAEQADKLLRKAMRAATDEELVQRAARLSMQINLSRGSLEALEKELLPIALGNPSRAVFRRLLVELYGAMALPLIDQAAAPDPEQRAAALEQLERIGHRAVKPLLDALGDEREAQQRIAIELLAHLGNSSAGPALFTYATGNAPPEARARAMIAVGGLNDPELVPKLAELLLPAGTPNVSEADPVSVAAVWALARLQTPAAGQVLLKLTQADSATVRALCAIGLGTAKARYATKRLTEIALNENESQLARATAIHALAEIGSPTLKQGLSALQALSEPRLKALVLVALARQRVPGIEQQVALNFFASDAAVQRGAKAASLVLSTGEYRVPTRERSATLGQVDVFTILEQLIPTAYTADETARVLAQFGAELQKAAVSETLASPERALVVVELLMAREGKPSFGLITNELSAAKPELQQAAELAAEQIAEAVVGPMSLFAKHPIPSVRASIVRFLATRTEPIARDAVLNALSDSESEVQQVALQGAARFSDDKSAEAIVKLLGLTSPWPTRVKAAAALASFGTTATASAPMRQVIDALSQAALSDPDALVREAAARALHKLDPARALSVLSKIRSRDPEIKVRELAQSLLNSAK